MQDYVTYTIILIGLFAIPTANSDMRCSLYNTSFTSTVKLFEFLVFLFLEELFHHRSHNHSLTTFVLLKLCRSFTPSFHTSYALVLRS